MADDTPSDEQLLYNAFNELAGVLLPLKQELRERALAMLAPFLGVTVPNGSVVEVVETGARRPAGHRSPPPIQIASREPPSPKDFLFRKQPNTDVERVACLAYYLSQHRDARHFKTIDISKLNTEAAQRKFANAAASVDNARRAGFLTPVGGGSKQLTAEGERFVDALPNRVAAQAILSTGKRKVRRQTRRRTAADTPAVGPAQAE